MLFIKIFGLLDLALFGTQLLIVPYPIFLFLFLILMFICMQAEALTNVKNPVEAGQELLKRGIRTKQVVIKMGSKGSIMVTKNAVSCAPAFKVLTVLINGLHL
jgi:hypothetical protein